MAYLLMFFLSALLLRRGCMGLMSNKQISYDGYFFTVIGLLVPILFAAFRDRTVGIDVEYYVYPFFVRAFNYNNLLTYLTVNRIDIIYGLINWLVSKITTNFFFLLLVNQTVIIFFTYAAFWNLRKIASPWLLMLYFYFLSYNLSLSTVRQSMGTALLLFALSILLRDQYTKMAYMKAIICIVIATGIQTGCVVGFICLGILWIVQKKFVRKYLLLGAMVLAVVMYFARSYVIPIGYYIVSLLNSKYNISNTIIGAGISDNVTLLFLCVGVLVISMMLNINRANITIEARQMNIFLLAMTLLILLLEIMLSKYRVIIRTAQTLQLAWPFAFAQIGHFARRDKMNQLLVNAAGLLFVFVYWWYMHVVVDYVLTMPYTVGNYF